MCLCLSLELPTGEDMEEVAFEMGDKRIIRFWPADIGS